MPKGWGSGDWSRAARRIRVPMGFLFAGFYLVAGAAERRLDRL